VNLSVGKVAVGLVAVDIVEAAPEAHLDGGQAGAALALTVAEPLASETLSTLGSQVAGNLGERLAPACCAGERPLPNHAG
jgi:hypothetical protein